MATYYIAVQSLPILKANRVFSRPKNTLYLQAFPLSDDSLSASYRHPDTISWSPNYTPKFGDVFLSIGQRFHVTDCAINMNDQEEVA